MPSNRDLEQKLDNIHLLVVEKFAIVSTKLEGVNNHLANLNGKVADHEKKLQDSLLDRSGLHGEMSVIKTTKTVPAWVAIILPIFSALVIYFLTH